MVNGKVQTTSNNDNVLVETDTSSNRNYCSLNKHVTVTRLLTDSEIIELWQNRNVNDALDLAKSWIAKQPGYAISSCQDKKIKLTYNSIVKYTKI